MSKETTVPTFRNETEEADWWFEHQDLILERFQDGVEAGALGLGLAGNRANKFALEEQATAVTVHLNSGDAEKAQLLAKKRGVRYEVFLEDLLHRELQKPEELESSAA